MSDFDGFYRAFEDRERGSRELILGRLDIYRPLLEDLVGRFPQGRALDVGCGRGEWLQLLESVGFQGLGVDLDAGMLDACLAAGLSVEQGDALQWLAAQPDSSLALISAFHVVEHIPFAMVQQLVAQAHRVLLPGGVLIMETPNPENLSVGAHTFYLDPSHERPLPPGLLKFVPEFVGFERSWVWRLQESELLRQAEHPTVANVLLAVSPDYAVIARKTAEQDMTVFDQLLDEPRGRDLELACGQYDAQHLQQHQHLTQLITGLEQRLAMVEQRLMTVEEESQRHQQELHRITHSIGWLLTLPFRWSGGQWQLLKEHGVRARSRSALDKALSIVRRKRDRPAAADGESEERRN